MSTPDVPYPPGDGPATGPRDGRPRPRRPVRDRVHWKRLHLIWVIWLAIIEPIVYLVIYPHLPPGRMTSSAHGDQFDTVVAVMVAGGLIGAVVIYFVYAFVHWRQRPDEPDIDGPPLRGHLGVQAGWVFMVSATVLGLFVFGTYELIVPAGSGGGEGPSPIWAINGYQKTAATSGVLPVQVIGQQWYWTYRYPTFGGFETTQLVLPVNTNIAFHVTSLDVVHDWWAYQLEIKADANPGADDVAFTRTYQTGKMVVRCDELCGIWHGAMYNYGHVVTKAAFQKWGHAMEKKLAPLTALLPKFSWVYYPSANGADGGYYPAGDPFYQYYKYYAGSAGREGTQAPVHVKASNTNASKGKSSNGNPFRP